MSSSSYLDNILIPVHTAISVMRESESERQGASTVHIPSPVLKPRGPGAASIGLRPSAIFFLHKEWFPELMLLAYTTSAIRHDYEDSVFAAAQIHLQCGVLQIVLLPSSETKLSRQQRGLS